MIDERAIQKFAAVYAEAVLTFLDSGEAQWVTWDGFSLDFGFSSLDLDPPSDPVMLFVDVNWTRIFDVPVITDPEHPEFDSEALRSAIETQILDEGYGERLLKGFQERLEKFQAGELDEDELAGRDEDEEG